MSHGMVARDLVYDEAKAVLAQSFVTYFSAYYEGKFVDRFGSTLPKPVLSQTVASTEIAGTTAVLFELILDSALHTPVWKDKDGNYYPGKKKVVPTAVTAGLAQIQPLIPDTNTHRCGITALKAQAIQYLAQTAGSRASMLGGMVGSSFGGISIGLGVLGKLSIGDNQTLQVLVKTALTKTFERAGEEAAFRILYWMPYDGNSLGRLIQKYLDSRKQQVG